MRTNRLPKLWPWAVAAGIVLAASTVAWAVIPATPLQGVKLPSSVSSPIASGDSGLWWDGAASGPIWRNAAGSDTTLGGGGGAVSSVSNSDGTLTISPTTGAVVASVALGHANTWTAAQTEQINSVGTAQTVGDSIANTTAAANNAQQYSPMLELVGQGWGTTGGASQTIKGAWQLRPVQGTVADVDEVLWLQKGGGSYTELAKFTSTVSVQAGTPGMEFLSGVTTDIVHQESGGTTDLAILDWNGSSGIAGFRFNGNNNAVNLVLGSATVAAYTANATGWFPTADNARDNGGAGTRWKNTWSYRYTGQSQNLSFSATPAFDCTAGEEIHIGTITANVTGPTMVAGNPGERCTIIFLKDGTAGTYTINGWGSNTRTAGVMTFTTTASTVFTITFVWDDRLGTQQWVETNRTGPI